MARLKDISDDWLKVPGRAERGFMMGYFNKPYMQQCSILVACDEAGTIQGFINQIPSFNPAEANFDFVRHSRSSLGNINDWLMLNFIKHLHQEGIARLNMGLSPLAGLEKEETGGGAIDAVMSFVYSNGNRFYSFQGLKKFKDKYEPNWEDRFIAYQGGLRGFTKVLNSLIRAMRLAHRRYIFK